MKVVAIIPSRLASTRLPEKPLYHILGKPMVQLVYEGVKRSQSIDQVFIATDSEKIYSCVESFGGNVVMTSLQHKTGTDRVCEVVRSHCADADIIINVQGDEPLIDGRNLDTLVEEFRSNDSLQMVTPIACVDEAEAASANIVKVVIDKDGYALYFSRSMIPYIRAKKPDNLFKHIGIYAFRKAFLLEYQKWPQTPLECAESLEQLRVLENGVKIKTVIWDAFLHAVDTIEDVSVVETYLKGVQR